MSAGFELQGMSKNGQLHFFTPLGTNLASLQWTTQGAQLLQGAQSQHFESLDALSEQLTGASLPIAELFDWLQGIHTQALGWEADLSQVSEGTLSAKRTHPMPAVVLRIKLD
jgi:outer membrane lipoprotein LolB